MEKDFDVMKYYMAAEKVNSLIFTINQLLQFTEEYEINPDDEVKKALDPLLNSLKKWIDKSK
jgi:hypothetical protein